MLNNEQRLDLLTSALEGGSNYWYFIGLDASRKIRLMWGGDKNDPFVNKMWNALETGESIEIHDIEDPEGDPLGSISLKSIEEGEQIMHDKYPGHYADVLNECGDADTGDVWFQLAIMKDIVYG